MVFNNHQIFGSARSTAAFENNGANTPTPAPAIYTRCGSQQKTWYTVTAMDARGNVTAATYGNGATKSAAYYKDSGLVKAVATYTIARDWPLSYNTTI